MRCGRRIRVALLVAVLLVAGRGYAQWGAERAVRWRLGSSLRVDSLGTDYWLDGAYRLAVGQPVLYAENVPVAAGMPAGTPRLQYARYEPLSGQVLARPAWVGREVPPAVRLRQCGGARVVEVELPAFRVGQDGVLERLVAYRLAWEKEEPRFRTRGGGGFVGKSESVLARGYWVRISVRESGMYKFTHKKLQEMGFSDPGKVTLWGLDGRQLSYVNRDDGLDDLLQIPLQWHHGGEPYALAYLRGPEWWEWDEGKGHYEYHQHEYEKHYNYYLTDGQSARLVEEVGAIGAVADVQRIGWGVAGYRGEGELLTRNGRERVGQPFLYGQAHVVGAGMSAAPAGMSGRVLVRVAARSSRASVVRVKSDGREVGALRLDGIAGTDQMLQKGTVAEGVFSLPGGSGRAASVSLEYERPSASATGWLVSLSFNLPYELGWRGKSEYPFLDPLGATGDRVGVEIGSLPSGVQVWDISDFFSPRHFLSAAEVSVAGGARGQLALFSLDEVQEPEYHGTVYNQNLHGMEPPEMLIVSHKDFLSQAEEVAAIYRGSPLTGLRVAVVDVEKVYNEFSAGLKDATAIRNFSRMLYWRGGGSSGPFKYLLLFGKPSRDLYDTDELTNFVPNYQTIDSYNAAQSFGSDDYFALLDEGEGEVEGGMDICVGRYAVRNADEAEAVLMHERAYHDFRNWGPWLSRAVFLADDGDGRTYMEGSDSLARLVERNSSFTSVRRLYADAFKQSTYWYKMLYPSLRDAFNAELRRGAFLVNYIGHGSELIMMHEVVSTRDNFLQWTNLSTLPVMVAASCRMAVYDQHASSSFTSEAVFRPQGGLMALIASSQYSFSSSNFDFNTNLIQFIYPAAGAPKSRMLGDAVVRAKNATVGTYNKRKYILLGNPALPLLSASAAVEVLSFGEEQSLRGLGDTIKGGSSSALTARVEDIGGVPFDGTVFLEVYGPRQRVKTYENELDPAFEFEERTVTLFRGKAKATGGRVRFEWITPRDADFSYSTGKIFLFAVSKNGLGAGSYERFVVGGQADAAYHDTDGPLVDVYLDDASRRQKYVVGRNPVLVVRLSDASGINCSGAAQGHDLHLALTREGGETVHTVLNEYYVADEGTYKEGEVRYQLSNLEEGRYAARVTAWDAVNNRGVGELSFEVVSARHARIENLLNYPNPFTVGTSFYLDVTTNEQPAEVLIQVFSVDGQLVRTLRHFDFSRQGRIGPIYWDGMDSHGRRVARGVYFYRVKVLLRATKDIEERIVERYDKLVVL